MITEFMEKITGRGDTDDLVDAAFLLLKIAREKEGVRLTEAVRRNIAVNLQPGRVYVVKLDGVVHEISGGYSLEIDPDTRVTLFPLPEAPK